MRFIVASSCVGVNVRRLGRPGQALGIWAVALSLWFYVPFVWFGNSSLARLAGVVLALGFGAGLALVLRKAFRRTAARPPVYRSVERRLVRLPAWVSAPLICCLYLAGPAIICLVMA